MTCGVFPIDFHRVFLRIVRIYEMCSSVSHSYVMLYFGCAVLVFCLGHVSGNRLARDAVFPCLWLTVVAV